MRELMLVALVISFSVAAFTEPIADDKKRPISPRAYEVTAENTSRPDWILLISLLGGEKKTQNVQRKGNLCPESKKKQKCMYVIHLNCGIVQWKNKAS